ncbi:hypothetical protein GF367_00235 [Candidatus Woesearchaeota archaeon]|nr:hypothetical protein [Candidatus Woesearchaeota archaeon]
MKGSLTTIVALSGWLLSAVPGASQGVRFSEQEQGYYATMAQDPGVFRDEMYKLMNANRFAAVYARLRRAEAYADHHRVGGFDQVISSLRREARWEESFKDEHPFGLYALPDGQGLLWYGYLRDVVASQGATVARGCQMHMALLAKGWKVARPPFSQRGVEVKVYEDSEGYGSVFTYSCSEFKSSRATRRFARRLPVFTGEGLDMMSADSVLRAYLPVVDAVSGVE